MRLDVALLEPPRGLLAEHARSARRRSSSSTTPPGRLARSPFALRERGGVEPERVVVLGEQGGGHVAGDRVERLLRRRRGPVGVAPALCRAASGPRAARHARRAPARSASSSEAAPSSRTWRWAHRPAREVHVRVGEAGEHAAAAEVDDLGGRERGLVRADAAGDPVAGDRERAARAAATGPASGSMPFSRITARL